MNWISNTIASYDSSHGITTPGFSISGVWGSASWTMTSDGVLTIGPGTTGAATLAAGDPMIELKNSIKSVSTPTASGTWGTAKWTLSSTGVLTIGAGTMGANTTAAGDPMLTQTSAIKSVNITGALTANNSTSLNNLFGALPNVTSISGVGDIITPSITGGYDASAMFQNDVKLTSVDLTNFNTASVTNMQNMFYGDNLLTSLDLSSFNTSGVTSTSGMFSWDYVLKSITFGSGWNTSNVKSMSQMFYSDNALTSLNLANFNTSNVTDMNMMFEWTNNLTTLTLGSGWNTAKVTDFSNMFLSDYNLTSLNLSTFTINSTANVGGMLNIMYSATPLTHLKEIVIGSNTKMSTAMGLNDPPTTSPYTGKWQNVGTGTLTAPNGTVVGNSVALESGVSAGTYVWQP